MTVLLSNIPLYGSHYRCSACGQGYYDTPGLQIPCPACLSDGLEETLWNLNTERFPPPEALPEGDAP